MGFLNYKKPKFWVISVTLVVLIILTAALTSNPGRAPVSNDDAADLLNHKTPYIGNNSKVVALLDALPLPQGITRSTVQLSTSQHPYGLTIHYSLTDDSLVISEEQFLRNSLFLFSLIDNVEKIDHQGYWNNKALSSTPFRFTYTRADAEKIVGGDIRQFAENKERLAALI